MLKELRCWAPNDITPTRVQNWGLGYPHPCASPLLAARTQITKPVSREMTNGCLRAPNMWDADFAPIKRPNPGCILVKKKDTSISTMAPLARHLRRGAQHPLASRLVLLQAIGIQTLSLERQTAGTAAHDPPSRPSPADLEATQTRP